MIKSNVTYNVSSGKTSKCSMNSGLSLSLCNCDANDGIVALNMHPMDKPHPSDQYICITSLSDHLLPRKQIGRYCVVSTSTSGQCLCIYAEYDHVVE